jgi:hypothetical protein
MNRKFLSLAWMVLVFAQRSLAATVPFTEDFTSDASNWGDASGTAPLSHVASGGPDGGGYASTEFNVAGLGANSAFLFRGLVYFNTTNHPF